MARSRARRFSSLVGSFLILLAITSGFMAPSRAPAQEANPNVWQPNGPVYTFFASDSTIFVGGSFNYFGPMTGGAALLNAADGRIAPPIGIVDGSVSSIASDGAGGWYICGAFQKVFGIPRTNLAHLRADLSVSDWNPGGNQPTNGSIQDLAVGDGAIYVAGPFTQIGGVERQHLAAFDRTTGATTPWNPDVDGAVECIATDGATVYAGGDFHYANGFPGVERDRVAAFDAQTGTATPWNPGADGPVRVLLLHEGILYAAGGFGRIGSAPRRSLAALDPQSDYTLPWDVQLDWGGVAALAARGASLFIGGSLFSFQGLDRQCIAEIDIATALPTGWRPVISGGSYPLYEPSVSNIGLGANTLYVSGDFNFIDGVYGSGVGGLDLASGHGTPWRPAALGTVRVFQETGGHVLVGGELSSIGGEQCRSIAEIDPDTGAAIPSVVKGPWGEVRTMTRLGATLYVGGRFYSIDGVTREGLAAFDLASGVLTEWNPRAHSSDYEGIANQLIPGDDVIYASGGFTSIAGHPRAGIAALDPVTGEATSWNPRGNAKARLLGVRDSVVYVAGSFTEIGGEARSGLAALDAQTAAATPWDPHAVGSTSTGLAQEDFLYIAGNYSEIGGQHNVRLAQLDYATGAATSWSPDVSMGVSSMAISDSVLYVSGGYGTSQIVRAVHIPTALTTDWMVSPYPPVPVPAIAPWASTVYLGGGYYYYSDYYYTYFAAVSADTSGFVPPPPPPPPPPQDSDLSLTISPNPTSLRAEIDFSIPADGDVDLVIVDVAGREVGRLVQGHTLAGEHHATFDARGLATGVYLARLEYQGQPTTRKFVLVQ